MKQGEWKRSNKITCASILVTGISILTAGLLMLAGCGETRNVENDGVKNEKKTGGVSAEGVENANGQDVVVLTLAAFGADAELTGQVESFNQAHADYKIVVEQYERSDVPEEDGIARLQREIMAGKGPDLINFGAGYATSDIVGAYTEDLAPFLQEEREKTGAEYFDNILELFRYNGKLRVLPVSFTMQTFAGSRAVLGDRESWNIRELMECYENRRDGAILYPGEMKKDVFGTLMHGNLDHYIDWENGSCCFDGEEFARILAFAGGFPDVLRITEADSAIQIFLDGGALLYPVRLHDIYDICGAEYIFGEKDITYIGYPVEEGLGTVVAPSGQMLAISVGSAHKDAAWEFLAGFLQPEYQAEIKRGFPICRSALEEKLAENREVEYGEDAEGNPVPIAKDRVRFEGEDPVDIYHITDGQAESLLNLIETASLCSAGDQRLYSILLEEADAYFSGGKSLEETCRVIQGRAAMYVSERVK